VAYAGTLSVLPVAAAAAALPLATTTAQRCSVARRLSPPVEGILPFFFFFFFFFTTVHDVATTRGKCSGGRAAAAMTMSRTICRSRACTSPFFHDAAHFAMASVLLLICADEHALFHALSHQSTSA